MLLSQPYTDACIVVHKIRMVDIALGHEAHPLLEHLCVALTSSGVRTLLVAPMLNHRLQFATDPVRAHQGALPASDVHRAPGQHHDTQRAKREKAEATTAHRYSPATKASFTMRSSPQT